LKIDKRNNLANIYTKQYRNMAAIYRRRRHAEWNSQAPVVLAGTSFTQGCNTLRLTYAHSHRGFHLPASTPVMGSKNNIKNISKNLNVVF